jgi:hypothetical protein
VPIPTLPELLILTRSEPPTVKPKSLEFCLKIPVVDDELSTKPLPLAAFALIFPATSKGTVGEVKPIPTLPEESIRSFSVPLSCILNNSFPPPTTFNLSPELLLVEVVVIIGAAELTCNSEAGLVVPIPTFPPVMFKVS